jgi:hypothetical protein
MRYSWVLLLPFIAGVPALAAEPEPLAPAPPEPATPTPAAPEPAPLFPETEPVAPEPAPEPLTPAPPRVVREAEGPYAQGKVRLGVGGGLLSSGANWNFGLALAFGVMVIDNVEAGLDGAFQFGDDPFAAYLGPTVRVLFPIDDVVHPYVGGFYRHWFLTEGLSDHDTLGARAGIVVRTGATFFAIGGVYEAIVSECQDDCSSFYPELGVSVVF